MRVGVHHFLFLLGLNAAFGGVIAEEQTCIADGDCSSTEDVCADKSDQCDYWASLGECDKNAPYMHIHCMKSCGTCSGLRQLKLENGSTFGVAQQVTGARSKEIEALMNETEKYMREEVFTDPKFSVVKDNCQNRNELCTFWALIGECEKNPKFMEMECAPSCKTCIKLDFNHRCPYDPDAPTIWGPGDLNKMFERITTDPYYEQFNPTILSQPGTPIGKFQDGPWVITLGNVLSEEETVKLIELGGVRGYEQSFDVGKKKFDGSYDKHLNKERTSTNSWCVEDCYENETTQAVVQRLENITGIPDTNSEYLQLLQYNVGQKYGQHHDYIPYQKERECGVRIITIFLYLNDVEAGGGTDFPLLDLTVMPKRGSALIWPSVKDQDPNQKDHRTDHQALPVEEGIKYGANAWVHQRSFKDPYAKSCI